jgi:hypothetical protein
MYDAIKGVLRCTWRRGPPLSDGEIAAVIWASPVRARRAGRARRASAGVGDEAPAGGHSDRDRDRLAVAS